jgi:hypothetical protein
MTSNFIIYNQQPLHEQRSRISESVAVFDPANEATVNDHSHTKRPERPMAKLCLDG